MNGTRASPTFWLFISKWRFLQVHFRLGLGKSSCKNASLDGKCRKFQARICIELSYCQEGKMWLPYRLAWLLRFLYPNTFIYFPGNLTAAHSLYCLSELLQAANDVSTNSYHQQRAFFFSFFLHMIMHLRNLLRLRPNRATATQLGLRRSSRTMTQIQPWLCRLLQPQMSNSLP